LEPRREYIIVIKDGLMKNVFQVAFSILVGNKDERGSTWKSV